jgi:hypothetical protein
VDAHRPVEDDERIATRLPFAHERRARRARDLVARADHLLEVFCEQPLNSGTLRT